MGNFYLLSLVRVSLVYVLGCVRDKVGGGGGCWMVCGWREEEDFG